MAFRQAEETARSERVLLHGLHGRFYSRMEIRSVKVTAILRDRGLGETSTIEGALPKICFSNRPNAAVPSFR